MTFIDFYENHREVYGFQETKAFSGFSRVQERSLLTQQKEQLQKSIQRVERRSNICKVCNLTQPCECE